MSRRNQRGDRSTVRTDRIASTLREIIGDELRTIDDDAVAWLTVSDVEVDNELTRARVYLSSIDLADGDIAGVEQYRGRLKKAIGERARIKRVPHLEFLVDPGLQAGSRVEDILRSMENDRAFADRPSGETDSSAEATAEQE